MALKMEENKKKFQWGELEDDDNDDVALSNVLPPKQVIGPDANGIKKTIEYKLNEEGNMVKITTTTRVRKLVKTHLSKRAVERRSWAKFGDAADNDALNSQLTNVSNEVIKIDPPIAPGTKQEDIKAAENPLTAQGGTLKLCRTCGKKGDHWTAQCPYKDLNPTVVDHKPANNNIATTSTSSKYVPPSARNAGQLKSTTDNKRRNDDNAVRVSNLSEDAREDDVRELFEVFGHVTRVYVGVNKGFGYVNFARREDAEMAIRKLDGYGYDNLILRVEWSAPRPQR